ncbi:hypothetical protein NIES2100_51140 [Calothrix sp. NIES-2100]|nr:hypothetical protein NIES2100_51140 [Calothrix sp. NIES-2100]
MCSLTENWYKSLLNKRAAKIGINLQIVTDNVGR